MDWTRCARTLLTSGALRSIPPPSVVLCGTYRLELQPRPAAPGLTVVSSIAARLGQQDPEVLLVDNSKEAHHHHTHTRDFCLSPISAPSTFSSTPSRIFCSARSVICPPLFSPWYVQTQPMPSSCRPPRPPMNGNCCDSMPGTGGVNPHMRVSSPAAV